jgi:beta-phosphoglucomutase-like phosphatase (HAD superfamily)
MVGDSPADWQAGIAAGVQVAAIVRDPAAEPDRACRLELGVPAYAGVREWCGTVFG